MENSSVNSEYKGQYLSGFGNKIMQLLNCL